MKRIVKCHDCGSKVPYADSERLLDRFFCIDCANNINESFMKRRKSEAMRKVSNHRWHPSPEEAKVRQELWDRIEQAGECNKR